jgi:uncharacterized membrane protein HdeD (DUF308 family)
MASTPDALAPLKRSAGLAAVVGVISLAAGILVIAYPDITLGAFAVIAGVNFLILGAFAIVESIVEDEADPAARVLVAVLGVLGVIAGLVVLRHPAQSLLAVIVVVGIWLVLAGIIDLAQAIADPRDRAARSVAGLLDVVLGIVILAWPDLSLKTLAVLAGIGFVLRGLFWLFAAWGLRRI